VSIVIGVKLQQLRKDKNYSLRKLAKLSGLSHSFICDIEHGRCNPSIETLRNLAKCLGVEPKFFLSDMVAGHDPKQSTGTEDPLGQ